MKNEIEIKVQNISKCYRIGLKEELHNTFFGAITSWIKSPLSNFRRVQKLSKFSGDGDSEDIIWALRDVSFEVKQGEVLGIIGKNGAGKSTLLKILCRIVDPSRGNASITGRIASLLEVGTGFHPELTGRENIFLNGAILGMTKVEIKQKFDEIVSFSGVEKFIDTPVKRYSSGMSVRLAFSVAAHLEPEILIIDEVLAVGDVMFQKKCLGKMKDVAKEGRTVLFVSHNMGIVRSLCSRVVMIDKGGIVQDGSPDAVISKYLSTGLKKKGEWVCSEKDKAPGDNIIRMHAVRILDQNGKVCTDFAVRDAVTIEMEYWVLQDISWLNVTLQFRNERGEDILTSFDDSMDQRSAERNQVTGFYRSTCYIPADFLNNGRIHVSAIMTGETIAHIIQNDIVMFYVVDSVDPNGARGNYRWDWPNAAVRPKLQWKQETLPLD